MKIYLKYLSFNQEAKALVAKVVKALNSHTDIMTVLMCVHTVDEECDGKIEREI